MQPLDKKEVLRRNNSWRRTGYIIGLFVSVMALVGCFRPQGGNEQLTEEALRPTVELQMTATLPAEQNIHATQQIFATVTAIAALPTAEQAQIATTAPQGTNQTSEEYLKQQLIGVWIIHKEKETDISTIDKLQFAIEGSAFLYTWYLGNYQTTGKTTVDGNQITLHDVRVANGTQSFTFPVKVENNHLIMGSGTKIVVFDRQEIVGEPTSTSKP